jgi:hypothetical protein
MRRLIGAADLLRQDKHVWSSLLQRQQSLPIELK